MSSRTAEDLSTNGVFRLLDEAYERGMRGYYLFGGEPTVRKDIGRVVDYAKGKDFVTTMNTNDSLLSSKAVSLRNLDFVFVSLDYFNEYHDFIRWREGSFKVVLRGVERIKSVGNTHVTLVTTISQLNFGAIKPMARFARDLEVGISYNAMEPTFQSSFEEGRTESQTKDYGLSFEQLQLFFYLRRFFSCSRCCLSA